MMRRKKSSFFEHLDELRATLIKIALTLFLGFIVAFYFHKPILTWLTNPIECKLVLLSPFDGFLTACKIAFITATATTSPLWIFFALSFLLPALYAHEKKIILPLLLFSFSFAIGAICFAYYITLPLCLNFLQHFSIGINLWTLTKTVSFILSLLLAHVVAFQLIVIGFFLTHVGLLHHRILVKIRRYIWVSSFILGAVLTPPDVLSQLLLAIPLIFFFEGIVLYSFLKKDRLLPSR